MCSCMPSGLQAAYTKIPRNLGWAHGYEPDGGFPRFHCKLEGMQLHVAKGDPTNVLTTED
jgi:hypothetical protein